MKSLVIRRVAERDLDEAAKWYESRRAGLGAEFLLSVETAIEGILAHPEATALVHKNLRRAYVHRFPYGVFYYVEETRIVIVGVIHSSRNPRIWKRRLSQN
ncbi:MAG: type II toxin-antitoxin system RelE/ParE family toxin [Pirellulaceae bacterium]